MYHIQRFEPTNKFYPKQLKTYLNIDLFAKGTLSGKIFEKTVGVVGSRLISDYGIEVMYQLIPQLITHQFTIVSGFSYGVDALAHELAINRKGFTIAILPCGINNIRPSRNKKLYSQILKHKSLLLAEDRDNVPCHKWTFAKRNKIIAALSDFLIVVEADKNSGSLITAKFSFEFNKTVYYIPHRIFDKNSLGVNNLYKQGGIPITQLDPLTLQGQLLNTKKQIILSHEHQEILNLIKESPKNIEELKITSSLNTIPQILTTLEINNLIINKGGYYYVC